MKSTLFCLIFVIISSFSLGATKQEIVAATLIAEAGGEKVEGAMEAVYEVILNRSIQRKISTDKVVLQKYQFSCWNGKNVNDVVNKAKEHAKWNKAMKITSSSKTNFTNGAQYYHTKAVNPSWNKSLKKTKVIGAHIFYK